MSYQRYSRYMVLDRVSSRFQGYIQVVIALSIQLCFLGSLFCKYFMAFRLPDCPCGPSFDLSLRPSQVDCRISRTIQLSCLEFRLLWILQASTQFQHLSVPFSTFRKTNSVYVLGGTHQANELCDIQVMPCAKIWFGHISHSIALSISWDFLPHFSRIFSPNVPASLARRWHVKTVKKNFLYIRVGQERIKRWTIIIIIYIIISTRLILSG